jgi:hypothetical protein
MMVFFFALPSDVDETLAVVSSAAGSAVEDFDLEEHGVNSRCQHCAREDDNGCAKGENTTDVPRTVKGVRLATRATDGETLHSKISSSLCLVAMLM